MSHKCAKFPFPGAMWKKASQICSNFYKKNKESDKHSALNVSNSHNSFSIATDSWLFLSSAAVCGIETKQVPSSKTIVMIIVCWERQKADCWQLNEGKPKSYVNNDSLDMRLGFFSTVSAELFAFVKRNERKRWKPRNSFRFCSKISDRWRFSCLFTFNLQDEGRKKRELLIARNSKDYSRVVEILLSGHDASELRSFLPEA